VSVQIRWCVCLYVCVKGACECIDQMRCVCVYVKRIPTHHHCECKDQLQSVCVCSGYATATHCNILQHTLTHCTTLQHAATHCNT